MKITICMIGLLAVLGGITPTYLAAQEITNPPVETDKEAIIENMLTGSETINSPLLAKITYRDAWMADNHPELSYFTQIENVQNSPLLDETTRKLMKQIIPVMKTMSHGLKGTDITDHSSKIQENPEKAIITLASQTKLPESETDFTSLLDLREELLEQAVKTTQKAPGQTSYPIDINQF